MVTSLRTAPWGRAAKGAGRPGRCDRAGPAGELGGRTGGGAGAAGNLAWSALRGAWAHCDFCIWLSRSPPARLAPRLPSAQSPWPGGTRLHPQICGFCCHGQFRGPAGLGGQGVRPAPAQPLVSARRRLLQPGSGGLRANQVRVAPHQHAAAGRHQVSPRPARAPGAPGPDGPCRAPAGWGVTSSPPLIQSG